VLDNLSMVISAHATFSRESHSILKANWIRGDRLNEQIGACGVYCGFCAAFRLEQNGCFGCE
jgi:hypothetical protein